MRLALAVAALVWFAAILIAPFVIDSTRRPAAISAACVYATGSFVCHQRPERSFFIGGRQVPVCARCTGLYAAAAVAAPLAVLLAVPMSSARARRIAFLAALPTVVTWLIEHFGFVHLSNTTRFIAALPLGFVIAWLIVGLFPHIARANHEDHEEHKDHQDSL